MEGKIENESFTRTLFLRPQRGEVQKWSKIFIAGGVLVW
jgi:hypothetical protein